ncbi:glycosyltransferase family 4 protein [Salinibacter ruber]|uniref:Glycosyl transferase, group 1 family protein n=1 Tax=Salinibacter ruber (strain DSM 13855 / M31) TaxID=309807 RepID=Q2S4X3_SALRD|nr:glycosyltransferase family 4 protein [Salinibacter ruber]ABC44902.1 glycosyl transferase, group 1 family protein [Salinibacter ruber DSM 13855]
MTKANTGSDRPVLLFAYACPKGFSGQKRSTEILIENINREKWDIRSLQLPAYEGGNEISIRAVVRMCNEMVKAIGDIYKYSGSEVTMYMNMGQSLVSIVRMAIPFVLIRAFAAKFSSVIALHGGKFMQWEPESIVNRTFVLMLSCADKINVLSPNQKKRLSSMGIPEQKIVVNPNTCTFPSLSRGQVMEKQNSAPPVRIMYLGLLIQTKGYFRYLEALEMLADDSSMPETDAILAGPISTHEGEGIFSDRKQTEAAIRDKIEVINNSSYINIKWLDWVDGQEKVDLYHKTHIFVFPSYFSVEAQPHVIMEALTSGCAVITSTIGEIPYQLDDRIGIQLQEPTCSRIADAIRAYAKNEEARKRAAVEGWSRFQKQFSLDPHLSRWHDTLEELRQLLDVK